MRRNEATMLLRKAMPELSRQFGVERLSIFGSVGRNQAGMESDIDILVSFFEGKTGGFFNFFRLKMNIEHLLGVPVDLVTAEGLRPSIRERVLKEAVNV